MHTWMKTDREEVIFAAEWSPSPTCSWTPSHTQTTARPQTLSAWTAQTAWRPASPPVRQTTFPGWKPQWCTDERDQLEKDLEVFSQKRNRCIYWKQLQCRISHFKGCQPECMKSYCGMLCIYVIKEEIRIATCVSTYTLCKLSYYCWVALVNEKWVWACFIYFFIFSINYLLLVLNLAYDISYTCVFHFLSVPVRLIWRSSRRWSVYSERPRLRSRDSSSIG